MSDLRLLAVEFLIESAHRLEATPIVKYTALSLLADRFYPSLSRSVGQRKMGNWLLQPMTQSNLQLFALVSIWISSKSLKTLGDKSIKEQHFTARDFLEAVSKFHYQGFRISLLLVAHLLEHLMKPLCRRWSFCRGVAKNGELIDFEACMDIMDLLYEKEETSVLYSSPRTLAASTLVASYVITVPVPTQRWRFPVLPWVKFVTSFKEEDIVEIVRDILMHVLDPRQPGIKILEVEEKKFL
ncbi:cyclin-J18 isoform X3 [Manihot esculenta]|uniref:Uncharacterized protein n=1 Tax=Manihot esculenta TaxID=3983 RepID=A0ACB7G5L5_MANES|nr:cyclin-J18 isoform X3 [Manihot esculenta]KAG8634818.1 hypothetical protein MANES_17G089333v8 [Manihot esculenta]